MKPFLFAFLLTTIVCSSIAWKPSELLQPASNLVPEQDYPQVFYSLDDQTYPPTTTTSAPKTTTSSPQPQNTTTTADVTQSPTTHETTTTGTSWSQPEESTTSDATQSPTTQETTTTGTPWSQPAGSTTSVPQSPMEEMKTTTKVQESQEPVTTSVPQPQSTMIEEWTTSRGMDEQTENSGWWTHSSTNPEIQWLDVDPESQMNNLFDEFLGEGNNQIPKDQQFTPYPERPIEEPEQEFTLNPEPHIEEPEEELASYPERPPVEEPEDQDFEPGLEEPVENPEKQESQPKEEEFAPYPERPIEKPEDDGWFTGEELYKDTEHQWNMYDDFKDVKETMLPEGDDYWNNKEEFTTNRPPYEEEPRDPNPYILTNQPYDQDYGVLYNTSTGERVGDYEQQGMNDWYDQQEQPEPEVERNYKYVPDKDDEGFDPASIPRRGSTPWPRRDRSLGSPMDPSCRQRVMPGDGPDETNSWYFDQQSGECRWFAYSGYGGNANRFYSRQSCENLCILDNTDPCSGVECPNSRMICDGVQDKGCLDYNRDKPDVCPPKQAVCVTRGGRGVRVAPKLREHMTPDICRQPKNPGNCKRKKNIAVVYFYDPESKICHSLYFNECGGNDNRFTTKEECMNYCSP